MFCLSGSGYLEENEKCCATMIHNVISMCHASQSNELTNMNFQISKKMKKFEDFV